MKSARCSRTARCPTSIRRRPSRARTRPAPPTGRTREDPVAEVMKPASATACPDLESIAAYLDGRLSDRERARITEHLASCEECYAVFSESAQTHVAPEQRTTTERSWREWFATPRFALASGGAVLAAAATVVLLVTSGRIPPGGPN